MLAAVHCRRQCNRACRPWRLDEDEEEEKETTRGLPALQAPTLFWKKGKRADPRAAAAFLVPGVACGGRYAPSPCAGFPPRPAACARSPARRAATAIVVAFFLGSRARTRQARLAGRNGRWSKKARECSSSHQPAAVRCGRRWWFPFPLPPRAVLWRVPPLLKPSLMANPVVHARTATAAERGACAVL